MKKILLIDDDKGILDLYEVYFSIPTNKEKYQFFTAPTIEKGKEVIKSEKPELILLDLILPKIFEPKAYADIEREELNKEYGFQLLKELKENPETSHIPVIILSNLSSAQDKGRATLLGARDYLVKSHVVPREVLAVIEKVA